MLLVKIYKQQNYTDLDCTGFSECCKMFFLNTKLSVKAD